MARRLRMSFADAVYHVINRGNYRADVFASDGAVKSVLAALDEACRRYRWRVHAYVVMRKHYHLGLHTPQPNLSEGLHWLQSTFATRFNRFRQERGHLFPARDQAIVVEGDEALLALCDYIHLNSARANVVTLAGLLESPWSSLTCFVRGSRAPWLVCDGWLERAQVSDSLEGWRCYVDRLIALAGDPAEQRR
jgi:putative transposase